MLTFNYSKKEISSHTFAQFTISNDGLQYGELRYWLVYGLRVFALAHSDAHNFACATVSRVSIRKICSSIDNNERRTNAIAKQKRPAHRVDGAETYVCQLKFIGFFTICNQNFYVFLQRLKI